MLFIFIVEEQTYAKVDLLGCMAGGPRELTFFELLLYSQGSTCIISSYLLLRTILWNVIIMPIWHVKQQSFIVVTYFPQNYPANQYRTGLQISSFLFKPPTLYSTLCCFSVITVVTMYWMPVWRPYIYIIFNLPISLGGSVLISTFLG